MPFDGTILFAILCVALRLLFTKGPYLFDYLEEKFKNGEKKFRAVKRFSRRMENYCKLSAKICRIFSVVWKRIFSSLLNKLAIIIIVFAVFYQLSVNKNPKLDLENVANILNVCKTTTPGGTRVISCDLLMVDSRWEFQKNSCGDSRISLPLSVINRDVADSKNHSVIACHFLIV